jgi:hypothetical protein
LGVGLWLLSAEVPQVKQRWRGLLILVFAFAPVFFGLIDGENATVSLLLYVLIYRALLRDQDHLVALWAALGLFKPQLFCVFPLVLLARRSWSALLLYGLTAGVLAVISLFLVGGAGLATWLRIVIEPESGQVVVNTWRMVSLKSFLDTLLPAQPGIALGGYLLGSAVLLGVVIRLWADRRVPRDLAWIFTSMAAVLVDPHMIDYDLTVLIPAGVLAVLRVPAVRWWLVPLYVVLVFRAHVPLGDAAVQVSSLVLFVCIAFVWIRARPTTEFERLERAELNQTASV